MEIAFYAVVTLLGILSHVVDGAAPKVAEFTLCAAPWYADTGIFNLTTGDVGWFPDQSSTVVRRLYPCPYSANKAKQAGIWTQTCNYNIYGMSYEGKRPKTTCINKAAFYKGSYSSASTNQKWMATTISWQSDVQVGYGNVATETSRYLSPAEEEAELQVEGGGRALARSNPNDWWYPNQLTFSNTKLISGTGKLSKFYSILQKVDIDSKNKLSGNNLEWEVALDFYYKKPYLNFDKL